MWKPQGAGWEQVPSVSPGGKPFFWYRRHGAKRQWYVWDRLALVWRFKEEG